MGERLQRCADLLARAGISLLSFYDTGALGSRHAIFISNYPSQDTRRPHPRELQSSHLLRRQLRTNINRPIFSAINREPKIISLPAQDITAQRDTQSWSYHGIGLADLASHNFCQKTILRDRCAEEFRGLLGAWLDVLGANVYPGTSSISGLTSMHNEHAGRAGWQHCVGI